MSALDQLTKELAAHSPVQVNDPARRQAGVALLLAKGPDRLLLIRRAERASDPWSGQLALPGGRRDAADADLLDTAIRETFEETGVRLSRAGCIATLDDLAPISPVLPAIVVRPAVFLLDETVIPLLNEEVAHAAWVSFVDLAQPGTYRSSVLSVLGKDRQVFGYHLSEGLLWGMTERMVTPIVNRWKELAGSP